MPITYQLTIRKSKVNIEKESIEGVLKIKNTDSRAQNFVQGFFIDLVSKKFKFQPRASNFKFINLNN